MSSAHAPRKPEATISMEKKSCFNFLGMSNNETFLLAAAISHLEPLVTQFLGYKQICIPGIIPSLPYKRPYESFDVYEGKETKRKM